jgi:hypothetical protein
MFCEPNDSITWRGVSFLVVQTTMELLEFEDVMSPARGGGGDGGEPTRRWRLLTSFVRCVVVERTHKQGCVSAATAALLVGGGSGNLTQSGLRLARRTARPKAKLLFCLYCFASSN